jgi:hypothetical protein
MSSAWLGIENIWRTPFLLAYDDIELADTFLVIANPAWCP